MSALLSEDVLSHIGKQSEPRREIVTRRDIRKYAIATDNRQAKYLDGDVAPPLFHLHLFWDVVPLATLSPAAEAYLWVDPRVATHRTRLHLCSRHPSGELNHVKGLATPLDKAIDAPNNDTLYTSGWYDLRHGDLVIEVPPMDKPDRYWNVMIADAYPCDVHRAASSRHTGHARDR